MERLTGVRGRASLRLCVSLWMSDRLHLFNRFTASAPGQELGQRIAAGSAVSCVNVDAAGWAHVAAALRAETGRAVVLVTAQLKQQETLKGLAHITRWRHLTTARVFIQIFQQMWNPLHLMFLSVLTRRLTTHLRQTTLRKGRFCEATILNVFTHMDALTLKQQEMVKGMENSIQMQV